MSAKFKRFKAYYLPTHFNQLAPSLQQLQSWKKMRYVLRRSLFSLIFCLQTVFEVKSTWCVSLFLSILAPRLNPALPDEETHCREAPLYGRAAILDSPKFLLCTRIDGHFLVQTTLEVADLLSEALPS